MLSVGNKQPVVFLRLRFFRGFNGHPVAEWVLASGLKRLKELRDLPINYVSHGEPFAMWGKDTPRGDHWDITCAARIGPDLLET